MFFVVEYCVSVDLLAFLLLVLIVWKVYFFDLQPLLHRISIALAL